MDRSDIAPRSASLHLLDLWQNPSAPTTAPIIIHFLKYFLPLHLPGHPGSKYATAFYKPSPFNHHKPLSQSPVSSVPGGSGQYMQRRAVSMIFSIMAFIMGATVLSNAFTGNLLSHLLIPKQNAPINTLEELVASSLTWLVAGGTDDETLFMVYDCWFYFIRAVCSKNFPAISDFMMYLIWILACRMPKKRMGFTGKSANGCIKIPSWWSTPQPKQND